MHDDGSIVTRREIMGVGATGLLAGILPAPLHAGGRPSEPLAVIAQGRLRGARERGVCVFRGIPYAGDPSAPDRRFKAPSAPPKWAGIRDATQFGAPAMQPLAGPSSIEPAPSEDCLFLNVWTPAADGRKRPVMMYQHGGGFTVGSAARPGQNGANLAREHDVVVVQSNHRLGVFGYLYLGKLLGPDYVANPGLLDLVAALRWVHTNIGAFGGDPGNVTIFGESGGGGKTACLYTMPSAAPFFVRASIESAIGPADRSPEQATEVARAAMRHFSVTDPKSLLTIPADAWLKFQTGGGDASVPGAGRRNRDQMFWPVIDGAVLPEVPFARTAPAISATKPLIVGGCRDEAVFFHFGDPAAFSLSERDLRARLQEELGDQADTWIDAFQRSRPQATPSQLYMAINTARPWREHAIHIAEQKARQGAAPVYAYILDYPSPVYVPGTTYPMGSPHASDIITKFDNVQSIGADRTSGSPLTLDRSEARLKTAANMGAFWTSFARDGIPRANKQPTWPVYTNSSRDTMIIDSSCKVIMDPESEDRKFMKRK